MKVIRVWPVLLMCLVLASQLAESVSLFALVQQGCESKETDEKETGKDEPVVQTRCIEAPDWRLRQARQLDQLNIPDVTSRHLPPVFSSQITFRTPISLFVVLLC